MSDKGNNRGMALLHYGKLNKILSAMIIDDEISLVRDLEKILNKLGIHVVATAHSGKDAAELYQIIEPDVVFLDLAMPEYDGFYALERIKEVAPSSKIIIVTTSLEIENIVELKVDAFVVKPFDIYAIKKTINWIAQAR